MDVDIIHPNDTVMARKGIATRQRSKDPKVSLL